jgi:DNA-binding Xre family transcriptional regulator
MKEKAYLLIGKNSKKWLAENLGISMPTLDKRLETDKWKKGEVQILEHLSK